MVVRNASDPRQVREAERKEKTARLNEMADMRKVLETDFGRRVMRRVLSAAGVFRSSFNPDAAWMAFNEGRRDLGLRFLAQMMEASPERYMELVRDESHEQDDEQRPDAAAQGGTDAE